MEQNKNTKKEFISMLPLKLSDKLKLQVGYDKAILPELSQDFLLDGDLVDFVTFVVGITKHFTPQNMQPNTDILIKKMLPNKILKADGVGISEVTAYLDKNGLPAGYIENVTEDGKRLRDYSQHFGFLDGHSFFYEDAYPTHRNGGVTHYVNLRDLSVLPITQQHEAYHRVILPAIKDIESKIAENAISHASVLTDEDKLSEM